MRKLAGTDNVFEETGSLTDVTPCFIGEKLSRAADKYVMSGIEWFGLENSGKNLK